MRLVDHPNDPGREESLEIVATGGISGLVVVMGRFTGRTFPDYFVATYLPDGRKATGACLTSRSRDTALVEWNALVIGWSNRPDEAAEIVRRHEVAA